MRRIACVLALAGLMLVPAPAAAAPPPAPELGVSSVHFAGRGTIEMDVAYRCVAAPRGAEWQPGIYMEVDQGRGRSMRWAETWIPLGRTTCDGSVHVAVVTLTPEYTRGFKGGRVTVWAYLDASWYNERTDDYVDQCSFIEGLRVRVSRHG